MRPNDLLSGRLRSSSPLLAYILVASTLLLLGGSPLGADARSLPASLFKIVANRGGGSTEKTTKMPNNKNELDDPWTVLGGGAINEKVRRHPQRSNTTTTTTTTSTTNFSPTTTKSHLLHAIEGLDRYPNYLSRWSLEDMDSLETALEEQLEQVKQQRKAVVERREGIRQLVKDFVETDTRWQQLLRPPTTWQEVRNILDPKACEAIFSSRVFTTTQAAPPTVSQVLNGQVAINLDTSRLTKLLDEEFYDVFSFRLLSLTFCRDVRHFCTGLVDRAQSSAPHLLVGRRPVDLDTVGLEWVNNLLFHLIVRPISRQLFQTSETLADLDWRQGYIAGYAAQPNEGKPRERLVTHTDDSEVTLNVCLGDESFEGGLLEFRGLRGSDSEGELHGTFQPQPGESRLAAFDCCWALRCLLQDHLSHSRHVVVGKDSR